MATNTGRKNKLERVESSKETGLYKSKNARTGTVEYFGRIKFKGVVKQVNLTKKYKITSQSKAEAKLKEWKVLLNNDYEVLSSNSKNKFRTLDFMFLEKYIPSVKNEEMRKQYKGFYLNYLQKKLGNRKYDSIENKDLQEIVDNLEKKGELSRRSLKKVQETLRPFYNELIAEKLAKYNPAIRLKYETVLRNERNLHQILITSDLKIPLQHILNEVDKIENKKLKLMFYIAIYCGRRLGEIQKIRWDNVVVDEQFIFVHYYDNKSDIPSKFFINEKIVSLLKELREDFPKDIYVFETDIKRKDKAVPFISDTTVRDKHREIISKLENEDKIRFLPELKFSREAKKKEVLNLKVHDYRHFIGSILHDYFGDTSLIKEILTHRNTDVTYRYSQISFKKSKEVLNTYFKLLEGEDIEYKLVPRNRN